MLRSQRIPRHPVSHDGRDSRARHQARAPRAVGAARGGLSLPAARPHIAGSAGPGASKVSGCHIRAGLLLAPSRGMPGRDDALVERQVLAGEA